MFTARYPRSISNRDISMARVYIVDFPSAGRPLLSDAVQLRSLAITDLPGLQYVYSLFCWLPVKYFLLTSWRGAVCAWRVRVPRLDFVTSTLGSQWSTVLPVAVSSRACMTYLAFRLHMEKAEVNFTFDSFMLPRVPLWARMFYTTRIGRYTIPISQGCEKARISWVPKGCDASVGGSP